MHYTLHLTNECNMACDYCYVDGSRKCTMTPAIVRKAIEFAALKGGSAGIVFFGGEPLLHKDLIYDAVEYCKWWERQQECNFHFKVTTNGLLLDREFMDFSIRENVFIALSHDGVEKAHDRHRHDKNKEGTFSRLEEKIDPLLAGRPYAPVLTVVNPDTAACYSDSVRYLYGRGFKYLICSLNYAGNWDDGAIRLLKQEYAKLSEFYYERTVAEDKFYLSPFEVKISSHINSDSYCTERCELGKKQVSIAPDGSLYPCVQFVDDTAYSIGHVDTGIDEEKRERLYTLNEEEKESCSRCAIRARCNHHCGCLNRQATGSLDKVSPVLCAHERLLMPLADRLAERLYAWRSPMFIQKHYNDMFPLLSLVEDKTKS